MTSRWPLRAALIALLLLLAALAVGWPVAAVAAEPFVHTKVTSGTFEPLSEIPASAKVVTVGYYPTTIYDIDAQSNTCWITAYVWVTWRGDGDPTASLEFANAVEESAMSAEPAYDRPYTLPDGSKYQILRVNGRFYQPYDLRRYPIDHQHINLYIEDSANTVDKVVFVADKENSGLDANMVIPGWTILQLTSQTYVHDYGTNFGDTSAGPAGSRYTSLVFTVDIKRDANFFFWKLLFPLFIVLLTNWLALLLRPNWVDLRTAMPATALLTAVFLQSAYSANLPDLSYLVLMDKIYVLAYATIIATLALIIWSNQRMKGCEVDELGSVRRVDLVAAVVQFAIFTGVLAFLILTA